MCLLNSSRLLFLDHSMVIISHLQSGNVHHVLKTVGFLTLFLLAFPITLSITCVTLLIHCFTRKPPTVNPNAKRILISSGGMTKSLQLARLFYSAGHYVVLSEEYSYTSHRYSRCVSRFYCTADTYMYDEYIQSIIEIVKQERIDVFVPVSHTTTECIDAVIKQALLPFNCETIHGDVEQLKMLSDKSAFIDRARALGLTAPKSSRITDPQQVLTFDFSAEKRQFILKSLKYDSVARSNLVKLPCATRQQTVDYVNSLVINESSPWILQEFIPGKEYCTHGTVRNGQLTLYACCPSSAWLLNYKHVNDKPNILRWVQEFCSRANITGQASFDFIESEEDGQVYPIECNPRTHTAITTFYNHPLVAQAYLNPEQLAQECPVQPKATAREIYWLYHELWNLFKVRSTKDLIRQCQLFLNGKEAIFSVDDPLPFFLHYSIHMPRLIFYYLRHMKYYKKIDCNLAFLL